jgi:hypothetical protein
MTLQTCTHWRDLMQQDHFWTSLARKTYGQYVGETPKKRELEELSKRCGQGKIIDNSSTHLLTPLLIRSPIFIDRADIHALDAIQIVVRSDHEHGSACRSVHAR